MAGIEFDANEVEPLAPMEPVPEGIYLAEIVSSDKKQTKNGTGDYIEAVFKIIRWQYEGRTINENLHIWNQSERAREYSLKALSSICRAVGVTKIYDTSSLHGIPIEIVVGLKDPDDKGRVFNKIKAYNKRGTSESQSVPESTNKPDWV